jgi:hypothetical protein
MAEKVMKHHVNRKDHVGRMSDSKEGHKLAYVCEGVGGMSVWADRLEDVLTSIGAFCTLWRSKKKNVHLASLFLEPVVDGMLLNRIKRCEVCGVPKCGLSDCIVLCIDRLNLCLFTYTCL